MSTSIEIPQKMRCVLVKDNQGPAENMYLGEEEVPKTKEGEVLVKVSLSSVEGLQLGWMGKEIWRGCAVLTRSLLLFFSSPPLLILSHPIFPLRTPRRTIIINNIITASSVYHRSPIKPIQLYPQEKIKAFGLNRMDIMQRQGKYPLPPQASKTIMGVEFAGEVVKLHGRSKESKEAGNESENGEKWKLGDEVVGLAYGVSLPLSSCIQYVSGLWTTVPDDGMRLTRLKMWYETTTRVPMPNTSPSPPRWSSINLLT
jgi:hypothetical protein